jgi:hypothetical protein
LVLRWFLVSRTAIKLRKQSLLSLDASPAAPPPSNDWSEFSVPHNQRP